MAVYLTDVIPFRFMIHPTTPRNGFLFGDDKGPWNADKITNQLTKLSTRILKFRMTMAEYRHIAVAIDRRFIRGIDLELDPDDDDDDEDDPHDLMAAHRTKTALNLYSREGGLLRKMSAESIDIFRSIADKWHSWLELVSRMSDDDDEEIEEVEEDLPAEDKLKKAMRDMYGATAVFRGKQEEVMLEVIKGTSPLGVCLPTGGGKMLTVLLPAKFKNAKTTLVITPLVALAEDLLDRCQKASIEAFIYGKMRQRRARVVIVTPESSSYMGFGKYIMGLHLEGRLERIILDEAHKIVTDKSYRPKLEEMKQLILGVQYVLLSATLPNALIPKLEDAMGLENMTLIREPSHKPNFRYDVVIYDGPSFELGIMHYVLKALDRVGENKVCNIEIS
jgi:hypothetical protein